MKHLGMSVPQAQARCLRLTAHWLASAQSPQRRPAPYGRVTSRRVTRYAQQQDQPPEEKHPKADAGPVTPEQQQAETPLPVSDTERQPQEEQPPVVEATNVMEPGGAEEQYSVLGVPDLPRMPDSVVEQSMLVHTGLAAVYMLQGLALTAVAWNSPGVLLPALASVHLTSMLLGCVGAMSIMTSGVLLHLRLTAVLGELGTWRHQRINAAVALYGVLTAASVACAVTAVNPLLSGLLLFTSLTTVAGCALLARTSWSHGPWLQWLVTPGDIEDTYQTAKRLISRDISTVAGVTCLVWMVVGITGASGVLLDPMSWGLDKSVADAYLTRGLHPTHPYATPVQVAAVLDLLRRVLSVGVLLSAVVGHTLLEAACHVRLLPTMEFLKASLVQSLDVGQNPVLTLIHPPQRKFAFLHSFSVLLPCVLLGMFLWRGVSLGVDVNRDVALMGPLHWTGMLAAAYLIQSLLVLDWRWVMSQVSQVYNFFAHLVSLIVQTFVVRLEWTRPHKL